MTFSSCAGDKDEINTLYTACTKLGFFYLKNHGVDEFVEPMFNEVGEVFKEPLEELLKYEMGDGGRSAGYKKVSFAAVAIDSAS